MDESNHLTIDLRRCGDALGEGYTQGGGKASSLTGSYVSIQEAKGRYLNTISSPHSRSAASHLHCRSTTMTVHMCVIYLRGCGLPIKVARPSLTSQTACYGFGMLYIIALWGISFLCGHHY